MNQVKATRRGWNWFHFLPLRDLVDRRTAPINDDYFLVFGDTPEEIGGRDCSTGYTDFKARKCWVNATVLPSPATEEEQIIATTFIAAHERAHARYTDWDERDFDRLDDQGKPILNAAGKPMPDMMVHQVWNILEDERIERLIMHNFRYLSPYMVRGSEYLLRIVPQVGTTDEPGEVISWVLRNRVANRANMPEPCPLSPTNLQRLHDIQPLVDEAFQANNSRRVVELAREIVKKLKLNQPAKGGIAILSGQSGQRVKGDAPEQGGVSNDMAAADLEDAAQRVAEGEGDAADLFAASGYSPPSNRDRGQITSAPYEALQTSIMPYTQALRQALQPPVQKKGVMFDSHGTRLSMRAVRRTPETPFRVEGAPSRFAPIALTVVIDESGSMAGIQEQEAKRVAMLCAEALGGRHLVRVVLAPTGRVALESSSREMGKSRVAGYTSNEGTAFGPVVKEELRRLQLYRRTHTCYLLLIADGLSDNRDMGELLKLTTKARAQRIHTIGVGVHLPKAGQEFFQKAFRDQFVEITDIQQLTTRMGAILQRMARRARH